jgi:hypothetical protein
MAGGKKSEAELNDLIERIVADAYGDDEQLWAFRQVMEDEIRLPADAFVVGEPVTVLEIDYDGNERRGLSVRCRREDGSEHRLAASDVMFAEGSKGADYVAAYRTWLGIEPYPPISVSKRPKATEDDLDLNKKVELLALAVRGKAVSCRILGKNHVLTLRPAGLWQAVPGEILTVMPQRKWRYAGHPYLTGEIKAWRLDIPALGLTPLGLEEIGRWDPKEHYWGEPDEPIAAWAKPMIKRGPRTEYEMEQVLPGEDPDNPDRDPILEAVDVQQAGDWRKADRMLMDLLAIDLRCLDAHAHLGNFTFPRDPDTAIRHYDIGVKIGELSLGKDFKDLLPWGYINNRPFLRCLHGYGLCLWRLGRVREAEKVFTRMLWLNPTDNQGARFDLYNVKEGKAWREDDSARKETVMCTCR